MVSRSLACSALWKKWYEINFKACFALLTLPQATKKDEPVDEDVMLKDDSEVMA